jgi:hypothetical protein
MAATISIKHWYVPDIGFSLQLSAQFDHSVWSTMFLYRRHKNSFKPSHVRSIQPVSLGPNAALFPQIKFYSSSEVSMAKRNRYEQITRRVKYFIKFNLPG